MSEKLAMKNEQRIQTIRERLVNALAPTHLEVIDESQQHIGHAGSQNGAGHFAVKIAADAFAGKNLVTCHRMIYSALGNMMEKEIHALRIQII